MLNLLKIKQINYLHQIQSKNGKKVEIPIRNEKREFEPHTIQSLSLESSSDSWEGASYATVGDDGINELARRVVSMEYFLKPEKVNKRINKKKYLEAMKEYKEKRKEILVSLKKQPNSIAALFTSSKTLETIIETANANMKIEQDKVDELVNKKVAMKRAHNILERSEYIVKEATRFHSFYNKLLAKLKAQRDAEAWNEGFSGGGSKKKTTSKRHIKRETKRHAQNNKRRYTKTRR